MRICVGQYFKEVAHIIPIPTVNLNSLGSSRFPLGLLETLDSVCCLLHCRSNRGPNLTPYLGLAYIQGLYTDPRGSHYGGTKLHMWDPQQLGFI